MNEISPEFPAGPAAPATDGPADPRPVSSEPFIPIKGTRQTDARVRMKLGFVFALLGIGSLALLLPPGAEWVIVCLFVVAVLLPCNRATYLDVGRREVIKARHYAWLVMTEDRRPLADFCGIVVRHVCHPVEDASDFYTGGVGLKPCDGKAVLWVKEYPATADDFPTEAFGFAQELATRAGLPFLSSGALRR